MCHPPKLPILHSKWKYNEEMPLDGHKILLASIDAVPGCLKNRKMNIQLVSDVTSSMMELVQVKY